MFNHSYLYEWQGLNNEQAEVRCWQILDRYVFTKSGLVWWHMKTVKKLIVSAVGSTGKLWMRMKVKYELRAEP